jgi:hypothetical protein
MARIGTASSGHRALSDWDTPTTHADEALNETHLDRHLDQPRPVPTTVDEVEAALAKAIEGAAAAGRFDVVAQLAKELEARRLARAGNVFSLSSRRGTAPPMK